MARNEKEITRATLKRGVSKKNPSKSYYIFDIEVFDDFDNSWCPFKVIFLSEFEGRSLRRLGVHLEDLETKEVDDSKANQEVD